MARRNDRKYRPKLAGTLDQATYSRSGIKALVEGERRVFWSLDGAGEPQFLTLPAASWASIRSSVEETADVFSEGFCAVMDLEMALGRLGQPHPEAAMVLTLRTRGWGYDDMIAAFGTNRNYYRLAQRAMAWVAAYLAGEDPAAAFHAPSGPCRRCVERDR
jgi:hypothetical protein